MLRETSEVLAADGTSSSWVGGAGDKIDRTSRHHAGEVISSARLAALRFGDVVLPAFADASDFLLRSLWPVCRTGAVLSGPSWPGP